MSAKDVMSYLESCSKENLLTILKDIVEEFKPTIEFINSRRPCETDISVCKLDRKKYEQNEIDLSKYHLRQIALQIQYDGDAYYGFAAQGGEDDADTVEDRIFFALQKLKLIVDRKSCNYSRCGRTDKGVSALGQIISVNVRSAIPKEVADSKSAPLPLHPGDETQIEMQNGSNDSNAEPKSKVKKIKEMDYATMLNKTLPSNIRVIGWCEVSPEFSSRFSAAHRGYRYFFVEHKRNIAAMKKAASYLIGYHDFRNICKLDVVNVTNFKREIFSADIICYEECATDHSRSIWMLEIKGVAFLWHMVRCIMAILFMVGEHNEEPEIVKRLLDIENCKSKPSYQMAPELPLVLHECGYDNLQICMLPKNLWNLTAQYEAMVEEHTIAAMRAKNSLEYIKTGVVRSIDVKSFLEEIEEKINRKARGRNEQEKKFSRTVNPDSTSLSWSSVLQTIKQEYNMVPELVPVPYIPLFERKCEETLLDKQNNLSGHKKERLSRHIETTADNKEETPLFFKRMRMQGSIQTTPHLQTEEKLR